MKTGRVRSFLLLGLVACHGSAPPSGQTAEVSKEAAVSLPAASTKEITTTGVAPMTTEPASKTSVPSEDPEVQKFVVGEKAIVAGTLHAEKYGGNAEYVLYLHGPAKLVRKATDVLGNSIGRLILRGNTGPLDSKRDQEVVVEIKNVQYDMNSSSGLYAICEVVKLAKIVR